MRGPWWVAGACVSVLVQPFALMLTSLYWYTSLNVRAWSDCSYDSNCSDSGWGWGTVKLWVFVWLAELAVGVGARVLASRRRRGSATDAGVGAGEETRRGIGVSAVLVLGAALATVMAAQNVVLFHIGEARHPGNGNDAQHLQARFFVQWGPWGMAADVALAVAVAAGVVALRRRGRRRGRGAGVAVPAM